MAAHARALISRDVAADAAGGTWLYNGVAARRLNVSPSLLGRITSSCFISVDGKKVDVGLAIRSPAGLSVPDFARPATNADGARALSVSPRVLATGDS